MTNIFFLNEVLTYALKYVEENNLILEGRSYITEKIQLKLKECLEYF
ncbi:MAG: hypothetical protein PHX18_02455 [Candidatus Gastranaerophilales bacterium]|nr:hypothetical protein [Candidatus Gastranaerophilales bacterium]